MVQASLFQLNETMIKACCGFNTFVKGEEYISSVYDLRLVGSTLYATIQGSGSKPYQVKVVLKEGEWQEGNCSCPSDFTPCKHLIAVLLKFIRQGVENSEPTLQEMLQSLDADTLRSILFKLIEQQPSLLNDVQIALVKPQQTKTPVVNTQAIRQKINYLLHQDFEHWNYEGLDVLVSDIKELSQQVVPFLEVEDGRNALQVIKAIIEPLLEHAETFMNYGEDDTYFDLLEKLERYCIEAILMTSLKPEEKKEWLKYVSKWNQECDKENFVAILEVIHSGWDYPLLKAVINNQSNFDEKELDDEEVYEKVAAAAFQVLKRQKDFDKCLCLAHLAVMDEEYAVSLIEAKRYPEAQEFIRNNIQDPHSLTELSKQLYEHKQSQMALNIALSGLFLREEWGNQYSTTLLRWTRDLAFELKQLDAGVKVGTLLFSLSPSYENYMALQKGAQNRWLFIKADLLQQIQTPFFHVSSDIIKILLQEDMLDTAIQLADKLIYIPDILIDEALTKRPLWALQKCQEAASQSIQNGSHSYDQAIIYLEHAYMASQQAKQIDKWVKYVRGLLQEHQRKYKLVPKLKELLTKHAS